MVLDLDMVMIGWQSVFNNKIQICYIKYIKCSNYVVNWVFANSFSSTNYACCVTHYGGGTTADQTTKVQVQTVSYANIGGNQSNMVIEAIAIGF